MTNDAGSKLSIKQRIVVWFATRKLQEVLRMGALQGYKTYIVMAAYIVVVIAQEVLKMKGLMTSELWTQLDAAKQVLVGTGFITMRAGIAKAGKGNGA